MKKTVGLVFIGLILVVGLVSAYRGDYSIKGPEYSEERHQLMQEAFENLDYNAWKEIMSENSRKGRVLEIINEDNFEIFVEAHNAMVNQDFEKANELRQELGLNNGIGLKDGNGFKQGNKSGKMKGLNQGKGFGNSNHNCMN
jgi:hypothetical protein